MAIALEQQIRQLAIAHVATGDKLVCPRSSLFQINPNLPYAKILRSASSVFLFSLPKCFPPDLYVVEKQKNNRVWFFKWQISGKQSLCFS